MGRFFCVRLPLTLCRADGLFDPEGSLITTSGTTARILDLAGDWKEKSKECEDLETVILVQPWSRTTPEEDRDSIKEKNQFQVVEQCPDEKLEREDAPVEETEARFLNSIQGRVAYGAVMGGLDDCAKENLSEAEYNLLLELRKKKKKYRSECLYGRKPRILPGSRECSDPEKALATDFFTGSF